MSRIPVLFALPALALIPLGCPSNGSILPIENPYADAHRAVLANLADAVILPRYRSVLGNTKALETATAAWEGSGTAEDRTSAKAAWRVLALDWQGAEVLQVGPAGLMGDVIGGEDLRDEIYSWPFTNACRVDQETVEDAWATADGLRVEAINVRGLDALEMLIFSEGTDNACAAESTLNTSGTWSALDGDMLNARRAGYAHTASVLVVERAQELVDRWTVGNGNFQAALGDAGNNTSVYPTAHEALESVSDAAFYIDSEVKDMKLALVAGAGGCGTAICPERLEFARSGISKEAVSANLSGLRELFTGKSGPGFDDLLTDLGSGALATEMLAKLDAAIAAVDAVPGTFAAATDASPASIVSSYAAVKTLTDIMKTEFVGVLDLELPDRAAGDND